MTGRFFIGSFQASARKDYDFRLPVQVEPNTSRTEYEIRSIFLMIDGHAEARVDGDVVVVPVFATEASAHYSVHGVAKGVKVTTEVEAYAHEGAYLTGVGFVHTVLNCKADNLSSFCITGQAHATIETEAYAYGRCVIKAVGQVCMGVVASHTGVREVINTNAPLASFWSSHSCCSNKAKYCCECKNVSHFDSS
ncbi:MAG: hypothetical protein CMH54_01050 [Myxococcales bacterium]|nr:hypothetical protein [Myxococcales bacterium]